MKKKFRKLRCKINRFWPQESQGGKNPCKILYGLTLRNSLDEKKKKLLSVNVDGKPRHVWCFPKRIYWKTGLFVDDA